MRTIKFALLTIFFLFISAASAAFAQTSSRIYFFYGTGCPHCAAVEQYFEEKNLFREYPIDKKEIYANQSNAILFNSLMDNLNTPLNTRGVPAVVLGDKVLIGDRPIIENFITDADAFLQKGSPAKLPADNKATDITLLATIGGALADAINPCEFAVLIILMTAILATGKATRALAAGLAFSTSIFISYFLMGLGLYTALGIGGLSQWFYKIIGWLAIVLGLLNLKDFFWYGQGFLMEVPLSWRPRLKGIINSVTSPAGAFAIGFLVSLFLLPCTSGPYIVILGMLAKKVLLTQTVLYLLLYNLIFISPMILISLAVYKGFNPAQAEKIRQQRLRILHLITALVMLAMGFVVLRGWI